MRRRTVYLSGPMTGIDDHNGPAFAAAAERFERDGCRVINPHRLVSVPGMTRKAAIRRDINDILLADEVHMLRGWKRSDGARLERKIALELGLTVTYERRCHRRPLPRRGRAAVAADRR